MKTRFTTVDIKAAVFELRTKLLGLRVVNVYDVDSKTYLIKLAKTDSKEVLLLESGCRFHTTDFEWPKSTMPSGFAMKMRKHLKSRRVESIEQVGEDRIVDFQFGSGEAAYHIILELYDRGNIVLTDHEYLILNILRPRTDDSQDVRFAVRETYPLSCAKQAEGVITADRLSELLAAAKEGDNLRKTLLPHLVYGPAVIDHCLLISGISPNAKMGKDIDAVKDVERLLSALTLAEMIMNDMSSGKSKGYIIVQQRERKVVSVDGSPELVTYSEFHPFLFSQHQTGVPFVEFESFDKAVDEFFSKIESQKLDVKLLQQEKAALKKLENVKNDHVKRLEELESEQMSDIHKAQLIEINLSLVDRAIAVVRSLLASQLDWLEIEKLVHEAADQGDKVAGSIKSLKLQMNHITMLLHPKTNLPEVSDDSEDEGIEMLKPMKVDIDLGLSAYANARKYFDMKRHAAQKQQKTINASEKALKSAERKTKQTLKEVQTTATINKARKTYWFEKFLWCISSENYLIIGGRDQQQNEMVVKRYLRPGDLYVHADLHGASSIVIKNPSKEPVPPKTLNEAGTMALCYSAAWEAKVITSAWWVYHDQVSKTAPSGEYLTTGSFMVRGKKNYLSPSHLIYGFGFLFKLDESCIAQHKDERRVRTLEEEEAMSFAAVEAPIGGDINEASADDLGSNVDDNNDNDEDSSSEDGHRDDEECSDADDKIGHDEEDVAEAKDEEFTDYQGSYTTTSCTVNDASADSLPVVTVTKLEPDVKMLREVTEGSPKSEMEEGTEEDLSADFPDTTIELQYVGGNKFALQARVAQSHGDDVSEDPRHVYLGDNKPVIIGESCAGKQTGRLSAKQRREMKKARQKVQFQVQAEDDNGADDDDDISQPVSELSVNKTNDASGDKSQQTQMKRGQKAKMKKIQEKYRDQDEEERKLRLELLGSAGAPKEDTKSKKGKKGKQVKSSGKETQTAGKQTQQKQQKGPAKLPQGGRLTAQDIAVETPVLAENATVDEAVKMVDLSAADVDDDEDTSLTQDATILDSLTGIPSPEDILLFCVPVCAPYTALTNYRFKVKLVPGTTKRGKAAKTALEMFIRDRSTTPREKDLFRSVKDADLSRSLPGKVKLAAPNLRKQQKHK